MCQAEQIEAAPDWSIATLWSFATSGMPFLVRTVRYTSIGANRTNNIIPATRLYFLFPIISGLSPVKVIVDLYVRHQILQKKLSSLILSIIKWDAMCHDARKLFRVIRTSYFWREIEVIIFRRNIFIVPQSSKYSWNQQQFIYQWRSW